MARGRALAWAVVTTLGSSRARMEAVVVEQARPAGVVIAANP